MSSYRPLRFLDASARADEIVANYKLGIGTHSQSSEVHVLADAPEIRVQDEVSEVTETALRITADGGAVSFQSGVDFTNDSKGDIKFESMHGGTTHMTIDGSSGNVGIGVANPAYKLDIVGAANISSILTVGDRIIDNNGIYKKQYSYAGVAANDDLYIGQYSIYGTAAKIEIYDTGSALGSSSRFTLARHYGQVPNVSGYENSYFTDYRFFYEAINDVNYHVWFRSSRAGNYTIYVDTSNFTDATEPSSPTLTECNYGFFSGHAGYADTSFAFRNYKTIQSSVEVHNQQEALEHNALSLFTKAPGTGETSTTSLGIYSSDTINYGGYIQSYLVQGTTYGMTLGTVNNYTRNPIITMNGSTNVGIGTTEPGGPLDVVTSSEGDYIARFKNSSTASDEDARIVIESSDAGGESQILLQTTDESTTHKWNIIADSGITPGLHFQYDSDFNAGTRAVVIKHGGNVVVGGTTDDYSPFTTYGGGLYNGDGTYSSKTCATLLVDRGGGGNNDDQETGAILQFRHHDDYRYVTIESVSEASYSTDIGLRFKTGDTDAGPQERMRITSGGNVGIGTTNPSHGRMQIYCSSQSPDGGLTIRGGSFYAGLGAMWVEGSGSGQRFNIQAYKNESTDPPAGVNPSTLDADAFELCLNPKGGNVGIGMTNPNVKLDVNGIATFRSQPGFQAWRTGFNLFNNLGGASDNRSGALAGFTEQFDVNGDFNPTTGVFTAPEDGLYSFGCNISWDQGDGNDDTIWFLFEVANNSTYGNRSASTTQDFPLNPRFFSRNGEEYSTSHSTLERLQSGATVKAYFHNVNSSQHYIDAVNFFGYKVA